MEKRLPSIIDKSSSTLLYSKVCGHLQCSECGHQRLSGVTYAQSVSADAMEASDLDARIDNRRCPVEWDKNRQIKWKKFVDMPRGNNSTQKEIVDVTTSFFELMNEIVIDLKAAAPHYWDKQWDSFQRNLLLSTFDNHLMDPLRISAFEDATLVIHGDFSSLLDIIKGVTLNHHIAEHAIQNVLIVSHSPRTVHLTGGGTKRIQSNDSWHYWGKSEEGKLKSNVYFHNKCLEDVVTHYRDILTSQCLHLRRIIFLSDGCAEQYKSRLTSSLIAYTVFKPPSIIGFSRITCLRKNALYLSKICNKLDVDEFIHTYAPTACFKCCCDSARKDIKYF